MTILQPVRNLARENLYKLYKEFKEFVVSPATNGDNKMFYFIGFLIE